MRGVGYDLWRRLEPNDVFVRRDLATADMAAPKGQNWAVHGPPRRPQVKWCPIRAPADARAAATADRMEIDMKGLLISHKGSHCGVYQFGRGL